MGKRPEHLNRAREQADFSRELKNGLTEMANTARGIFEEIGINKTLERKGPSNPTT